MGDRYEYEAEAACGPWHVGLEAAAEVCAVAAFGVATLEPRHRQTVVAFQFTAESVERDAGASREVVQILGDCVLVEQDRYYRPGGAVRHR